MGFWDGLGKCLGNLAKAGYEKMRETNDEIANEMMKMEDYSLDELRTELHRGNFAHRMAAKKLLKEVYDFFQDED